MNCLATPPANPFAIHQARLKRFNLTYLLYFKTALLSSLSNFKGARCFGLPHGISPPLLCQGWPQGVIFKKKKKLNYFAPISYHIFDHFFDQGVHGVRQRVGQGRGAEISDLLTARKPSRGQRRSSPTAQTGGGATGALSRTFAFPPVSLFFFVFPCFPLFSLVFPCFC